MREWSVAGLFVSRETSPLAAATQRIGESCIHRLWSQAVDAKVASPPLVSPSPLYRHRYLGHVFPGIGTHVLGTPMSQSGSR